MRKLDSLGNDAVTRRFVDDALYGIKSEASNEPSEGMHVCGFLCGSISIFRFSEMLGGSAFLRWVEEQISLSFLTTVP
jgi:hypothetical protein